MISLCILISMSKAARAIIIENNKLLVMHRNKYGSEYFTLVGGRVNDGETTEEALLREIKEETGLNITAHRLVFIEEHGEPYNEQYIYLCSVAPFEGVAIQETSEENFMNKLDMNTHEPIWVEKSSFPRIPFRTIHLQNAIVAALKKDFPLEPVKL
jgi:ADP-ribose pyrophosphatase YjhB (NUDIX family)